MLLALFDCELTIGYQEVLDRSCLANRTLNFNNDLCLTTTARPLRHIPGEFRCPDENKIGVNCDIPNNPCSNPELCSNHGTCASDGILPDGYICQCSVDYDGQNCEIDNRVCKNNTCW